MSSSSSSSSSSNDTPKFGFERWKIVRKEWLKERPDNVRHRHGEVVGKNIDNEDVIERIFSQTG